MSKVKVIYDGDMGGDDLIALAVLLGYADHFDIRCVTSVFGNVRQNIATMNVGWWLQKLGVRHIPIYSGYPKPFVGNIPLGDDAYGKQGLGSLTRPTSLNIPMIQDDKAHAIIAREMRKHEGDDPLIILSTGPATNLARAFKNNPELAQTNHRIIALQGALNPPGKDGRPVITLKGVPQKGNITPVAEFNAFMDPFALNALVEAGANISFMTLDATQRLVIDEQKERELEDLHPVFGSMVVKMLANAKALDQDKFKVDGAFLHDPHVVAYLVLSKIMPDLKSFTSKQHPVRFAEVTKSNPEDYFSSDRGRMIIDTDGHIAPREVFIGCNPSHVFKAIQAGLTKTFQNAPSP